MLVGSNDSWSVLNTWYLGFLSGESLNLKLLLFYPLAFVTVMSFYCYRAFLPSFAEPTVGREVVWVAWYEDICAHIFGVIQWFWNRYFKILGLENFAKMSLYMKITKTYRHHHVLHNMGNHILRRIFMDIYIHWDRHLWLWSGRAQVGSPALILVKKQDCVLDVVGVVNSSHFMLTNSFHGPWTSLTAWSCPKRRLIAKLDFTMDFIYIKGRLYLEESFCDCSGYLHFSKNLSFSVQLKPVTFFTTVFGHEEKKRPETLGEHCSRIPHTFSFWPSTIVFFCSQIDYGWDHRLLWFMGENAWTTLWRMTVGIWNWIQGSYSNWECFWGRMPGTRNPRDHNGWSGTERVNV